MRLRGKFEIDPLLGSEWKGSQEGSLWKVNFFTPKIEKDILPTEYC